ncbi:MAG: bifunctional glutamate N-acetyltransferase/amino-acid acetyltransferase ArgJ [Lachnospiraceae bacterium]|nr:bifunctional glutamate N-acetyltransferase/amino-acid acetyltransferase ArgJ [Lachnospiraceae bacterium]
MKVINGGVTAAMGFEAAGVEAAIKYKNRKDMAMVYSVKPCVVAGTFTTNRVKAAPVLWDMKVVEESEYAQAVVVNSGIANAGTGKEGYGYCEATAAAVSKELNIPQDAVLVASTGVIGMQLPIERLVAGVEMLAKAKKDTIEAGTLAAEAIMTTDTISKQVACQIEIGGKTVTIGGMSKGSGMIHPNMCTMLGFITTDAVISKPVLTKLLKEDVVDTFNMISVDGDTSTNDSLILMANGMAENPEIKEGTPEYEAFKEALHYVNETLAKMMAGDGEGATALFEAKVIGADTKENARILAKSVIGSSLCKAAIYGHDANWGRFLCALGYAGVEFDPDNMELFFESKAGKILIYKNGAGVDYSEEEATKIISEKEVTVIADMKMGTEQATAWGCDLTYDYVKINADYRS